MQVSSSGDQNAKARQSIHMAVRTLAETIHRRGGLAGPIYGCVSAADGIRLHQRFISLLNERHGSEHVESEVALQAHCEIDDWLFLVNGRCDALLNLPDGPEVIEAKSFMGPRDQLPQAGESVHWAQANLYAWLYLSARPGLQSIKVGLAYVGLDSGEFVEMSQTRSRGELADFFNSTCRAYADFTGNQLRSKQSREQSGLACHFPYPDLRSGQKRFMQEVIGAARHKDSIFIQAPTGTGKTMAAIYPAVKALANHLVDHVFYLTAMTSTRLVAAKALEDLRLAGLRMKYLVLFAKEKLCLQPELYCDDRRCPFATAYYDHLPAALRQLFLLESIGRDEILECARQHQVCPFELSLDIALYCEFIICDYNYAFDPRVKLDRFFNQDLQSHLLLVDEAHNLPARSREMFSAAIDGKSLQKAQAAAGNSFPMLTQALSRLQAYFDAIQKSLSGTDPGFDQVEKQIPARQVMVAEEFRAVRDLPAALLVLLGRFSFACRQFLDQNQDFPQRRDLLDFYFTALFFIRVAEEFHDKTYVTTARKAEGGAEISLMCLDASNKLAASYQDRHPAVFYSATLSPLAYYVGLICGTSSHEQPETLLLASPFPAENLKVVICSALSTRYQQRQATVQPILRLIMQAARQHTGNYLVFVPSFTYLSLFRNLIRSSESRDEFDWMFQSPNMSETLRQKFMHRFDRFGERTLLAVAVMGGVFSEGIDLIGEKLSGVMIIGVGLPQICPEREIMKQYYAETLGSGYEYAYLYPGFNKVQQAAGRVIRSEDDRGFVLLIDDRYATPVYNSLFPNEWHPVTVQDELEAADVLREFWSQSAGRT